MGLSRRQFTKEFKLAAVRRLEQSVLIGEAARALQVNPNVLHRPDRDMDLRDAIQRIGLEWPSYGRPRITAPCAGGVSGESQTGLPITS